MPKPTRPFFTIIILLASGCLFSCRQTDTQAKRSFCYWKTSFDIMYEDSILNALELDHMYVRFFDVDWNPYNKEALPVGTLYNWRMRRKDTLEFTPSVFITNTVLEKCSKLQLDTLAKRIMSRVDEIINGVAEEYVRDEMFIQYNNYWSYKNQGQQKKISDSARVSLYKEFRQKFNGILIDCDWTVGTQENYFYLLGKIKEQFVSTEVTATIRLWQFKYPDKTGIPPVDRGLLMCYNLDNVSDYKTQNSICTTDLLSQYLTSGKYDLPLDIALPVFSWTALFRENVFKGIITDFNITDTEDTARFYSLGKNRFLIKEDMVIGENYIRPGDEIRVENVPPQELEKIAAIISKKLHTGGDARITFFAFDKKYIYETGIPTIDSCYRIFGL